MPISKINFFADGISYAIKDKKKMRSWLISTAHTEGFSIKEINYVFCTDDSLLEMNQAFLKHDTYTDIITFDNSEKSGEIIGEIYISIDRIHENSLKYKTEILHELRRVMVHGVLHLCGYKDKTSKDSELMRSKEDEYLCRYNLTLDKL